jgi:hypothetical protein
VSSSHRPHFDRRRGLIWLRSHPIAGFPDEENENRNHPNHEKHPVLTFEAQKSKMLNKKSHRSRPRSVQDKCLVCAG